jgi:hypothetical protein
MAGMDPANAKAIEILDSFVGLSARTTPVDLADAYLQAIDRVESLPANGQGADKSWVEAARRDFRDYMARARRARPQM